MKKTLYFYTKDDIINSKEIIKKCLLSWKVYNPSWEIVELNNNNLKNYLDLEKEIPNLYKININNNCLSILIGILILEKYGGCYIDKTVFCNKPLDEWLNEYYEKGFFGFFCPNKNKLIANWFLYSEKNNYIIKKWKDKILEYLNKNQKIDNYYWAQNLFSNLYKNNKKIKKIYDNIKKISTKDTHLIQNKGLLNKINENIKNNIDKKIVPMYKLKNINFPEIKNSNSNLSYLINQINIKFIHIGKCGGTFIENNFDFKNNRYHLNRKYKDNEKYIIWIRNPLKRFVSAFNYSCNIINLDTKNLDINNLTIENCLAPCRIYKKIRNNNTYSYNEEFDNLINFFRTPNYLAESLTSDNLEIKNKAEKLMNYHHGHIFKGIGWYMFNGNFIKNNFKKIIFVGSIENMEKDILKLEKLLSVRVSREKIRNNNFKTNKYLSEQAIKNLINFYKYTDYKALKILKEYNFISEELLSEYYTY